MATPSDGRGSGNVRTDPFDPEWRDDVDRMIAWADAHVQIVPLMAGEAVPAVLREYLRTGRSDVFDHLVAATQADMLLVTDDYPIRELAQRLGRGSTWLHLIF